MTDPVPEIAEAARAAREEGLHPPGLDRELDESWRRLVRRRPGEDRLTQAIWAADASAHVNADAGLADTHGAGKRLAKRLLAKLVRWYILRVTSQVTTFAYAATTALRLLSDRVEALVEEMEAARPPALPGRAPLTSGRPGPPAPGPLEDSEDFAASAVERLAGAPGRVLHADCRSGEMLRRLADEGVDAYGVEAFGGFVDSPAAPGLDLLQGEALAHLRSVPPHGLGGALLSGFVDRLPAGDARLLAFLLSTRIAPGGTVVLVTKSPAAWRVEATPLERDLSPGRPLHPETWCHLLGEYGFSDLETVKGRDLGALGPTIRTELPVLRHLLGGPASYLVAGRRPG